MARVPTRLLNSRSALSAAVAILLVVSVLPGRLTPFVGWLSSIAELAIAPVQRPVAGLVRMLRGPQPGRPTDGHFRALEFDRDQWALKAHQADLEIENLQRQIVQLQRGMALNPQLAVRQRQAPVIGFGSDAGSTLLKVQAGERDGIVPGSVAAFDGVNLVGRVTRVEGRISRVTPITDKNAGGLGARVFAPEAPASAPGAADTQTAPAAQSMLSLECKLSPNGRGRLVGPVEWTGLRPDQVAMKPAAGMVVRLSDTSWPASAQMLVIGVVEDVSTNDVGRTTITVKPMFDLQRLGEVTIRVSGDAEPATGETGGPR